MTAKTRERLALLGPLALACATFFLGITWGLPSRQIDQFLFASTAHPWSGADIVAAGGAWKPDTHRAADADADPLTQRDRVLWLNQTPRQQAEIIRRYRLFSYQPDEMVTFLSLAGMRESKFDPRMYQYGGLWIYPVGALLRIAGTLGLVELTPEMTSYLDRPEAFGHFYVVARAYSAAWGLVGVWAVFHLAKRFSRSLVVPAVAATCFALMPVVINAAHEAKPHLAGAVLTLAAVLAATKYAETGARKWCLAAGLLCGLATGMVLSAAVAFVVLPLMTLLRPDPWPTRLRKTALATLIGVAAYCVTNPYVPINLVRDRDILRQNLGALSQAKAITGASSDLPALPNARRLIASGAGVLLMNVGVIGLLVLLFNRAWLRNHPPTRAPALLLGVTAGIVLVQFLYLAGGKPGEFGRFAILPDIALALCAVITLSAINWGRALRATTLVALVGVTAIQGISSLGGFLEDAWARDATSSRTAAAREIQRLTDAGAKTLAVRADPAPYSLPPIDLTHWKLILLPEDGTLTDWPDVIVRPVDTAVGQSPSLRYRRTVIQGRWPRLASPISWADKPIEILVRRDIPDPGSP